VQEPVITYFERNKTLLGCVKMVSTKTAMHLQLQNSKHICGITLVVVVATTMY
jgi:hypothetical protein